jgi:hypothetical protein
MQPKSLYTIMDEISENELTKLPPGYSVPFFKFIVACETHLFFHPSNSKIWTCLWTEFIQTPWKYQEAELLLRNTYDIEGS